MQAEYGAEMALPEWSRPEASGLAALVHAVVGGGDEFGERAVWVLAV